VYRAGSRNIDKIFDSSMEPKLNLTRRDLSLLLPLLATQVSAGKAAPLPSQCYSFESLPVHHDPKNGAESRQVFTGTTHDGFPIDLHITTMPPGQMPHPPHHHVHEEMMLIQTGYLEATIAGKSTTVGPGSVIYIHSNEEHGLKNCGQVTAQYFVLALGKQA
jgi:quercetin dioxygenase-like cupin family protein